MIVGYARVSTDGQTFGAQQAALRSAGAERSPLVVDQLSEAEPRWPDPTQMAFLIHSGLAAKARN
jgi:Resolvase, N terminal domain